MSLGTCFFQKISGCGLAGKQQDLAAGKQLTYLDGSFNSIHVLHDHVTDYEFRLHFAGPSNGGVAGINCCSVKAILVEDDRKSVGDHALIIHDENAGFSRLSVKF